MGPHTQSVNVSSAGVSISATASGDPSAEPIVLIHGYPDTGAIWDPVVQRLADRYRCIVYDVRGAGSSDAPRGRAAYDVRRLADDFAAVCAALAPGRPVHLVGHDWGGIQGWEFVTAPRFAGQIATFTTIAGPSLGHAVAAGRTELRAGRLLAALDRARRSWYIIPLCLPGGPSIAWRVLLAGHRWRAWLERVEHLPVDGDYPAPSAARDGLNGANLYRRNIPRRLLRRRQLAPAHAPVQVIIPEGDRFISPAYYDAAERVAPRLTRRSVPGSHWAPRSQPELVAGWIAAFAGAASG